MGVGFLDVGFAAADAEAMIVDMKRFRDEVLARV
jgi:hypothetical protein